MQRKEQEWDSVIEEYIKSNMWIFERARRCATVEHYDALGEIVQA